ncbi:hypothetical protein PIB30_094876 [Stylosanthes scabra]|uniref:Uncharacterized protein n=1 Tax=Stylosanthes scabra TaxID=79078 RepID=A0ABU6UXD2_9FABA|nr:hypothetical protein [Stylosanthes scabra]
MPQAGEGNEEGNEEEQGYDHDYHHQHDFQQQQPEFEHHQDFKEEPPQQTLENISKNQAEYMAELRDIKGKQQELYENNDKFYNQEILDVKKYQMSAVTMGSGGSSSSPQPQRYEPDQALMKIREQHANFSEMQRQLRDWTRNASARETYTVWVHQQVNPNVVEMSSQKIVKQIYDHRPQEAYVQGSSEV